MAIWPSALAAAAPWLRDSWTMRRSISTKLPEIGRLDHVASGVMWNSTSVPLSRLAPVTSGVPSARLAQVRSTMSEVGSASTCRVTVTSLGGARSAKGPVFGKFGDGLRRGPGQRAAHRALAKAQANRKQLLVIAGRGETRSREADQRAAVLEPVDQQRPRRVGNGADIGHDDHRGLLLEKLRDGFGEIGARWLDQIGERLQGAANVIKRRQQGLRLIGFRLRQQADAAALGILVEHADGGGVLLAIDGDRGKIIAQFKGHCHLTRAGGFAGAEGDDRIGDAPALVVESAGGHLAGRRVAAWAYRRQGEAVDLVLGTGQANRIEALGHGPEQACRRASATSR